MSNPAIQKATAPPSRNGCQVTTPVTATHAPTGPSPMVAPRMRWHIHVQRLVSG